ncbi:NifU family protein [Haloarcula salinisoli]|uniref:NifU family protein n=1 Tax=Haloarcula salinisoli TaxID=2487746 RepID=A0A8J7YK36_9EURY|nr:NifU family protein [Halomicroarcula salinisoli]MBX0287640.1 NifU family protein [Halomicroarcula salinisoli]MBX0304569.1 NifU family protein [Halomicroarcula salinisoli]
MSTETGADDDNDLRERITNFLRRNFPQIQMHGGSAAIENIDREEGSVTIRLGGACSGCGISPMTIQAIKTRMTKEIPEINEVVARTGQEQGEGMAGGADGGMTPSFGGGDSRGGDVGGDDEGPEAPF